MKYRQTPPPESAVGSAHEADSAQQHPDEERLLSPELSALLRDDLAPRDHDRDRIHSNLRSTLASGTIPTSLNHIDAAMTARAAAIKAGTGVVGHALGAKLVVLSLAIATASGVATVAIPRYSDPHSERSKSARMPAQPQRPAQRKPVADEQRALDNAPDPAAGNIQPPTSVTPAAAPAALAASKQPTPIAPQPSAAARHHPSPVTPTSSPASNTGIAGPALSPPVSSIDTATARTSQLITPIAAAAARPAEESKPAEQPSASPVAPLTPNAASPLNPHPAPFEAIQGRPALTLGAELALVRGASNAVDRHDYSSALDQLSRYAARYPSGAFLTEVAALRAISLCEARRPGADAARDSYLRAHGSATLAARVRNACRGPQ
ncbi:MAG: hypothetical protein RL701_1224 [Pseudomonadota bacterium]|jgi:hypothetical protein